MRTNVKKIVSLLLALLFMLSMGAASLAETITNAVTDSVAERKLLALIDSTWAELDAVEEQLFASKATEEDTIDAMFDAAEECEFIDEGSVQMVDEDTFEFTVSGMHCMYDYRISSLKRSDEPTVASGKLGFEPRRAIPIRISIFCSLLHIMAMIQTLRSSIAVRHRSSQIIPAERSRFFRAMPQPRPQLLRTIPKRPL